MIVSGVGNIVAKKEIIPLQFLRGVAAVCVLLSHFLERLVRRDAFPQGAPEWLLPIGSLGVMMFFAISGFIMVYTTQREFEDQTGSSKFLVRRIIRIVPLYYVITVLMLAFQNMTQKFSTADHYVAPDLWDIIRSFLFIPYMQPDGLMQPAYGLGWSLNYEMMFYLLFALGIQLGRKTGLFLILSVLCLLSAAGLFIPAPDHAGQQGAALAYFYTRPVLLYFVAGIGVALAYQRIGPQRAMMGETALCLLAGSILFASVLLPQPLKIVGVTFALCLATFFWRPVDASSLFSRLAKALGDASYSIYLLHSFLLGILALAYTKLLPVNALTLPLVILFAVALCGTVGWLSWRFFEVPVANILRDRLLRRRPAAAAAQ